MSHSTCFKLAQSVGILGSAGATASHLFSSPRANLISPEAAPATPPSQLLNQWLYIYNNGKKTFPYIVTGSALAYLYLAYVLRNRTSTSSGGIFSGSTLSSCKLYLAAAVATFGAIPYTLVVVEGTIKRLQALARQDDGGGGGGGEQKGEKEGKLEEVPRLIARFGQLNLVRSIFPLVGAVVGVVAALW
ncbi:hypothetical protein VTN77DRAFT_5242 [Rasamsonia byssochlamydoides]|uniref:uncharacterized protein n=1 Tax=Rasamsonia byssochlamydoides TaxID=89139 RepID=UPI003742751F